VPRFHPLFDVCVVAIMTLAILPGMTKGQTLDDADTAIPNARLSAVQRDMALSQTQAASLQRRAQAVAAQIAYLEDASVAAAKIAQQTETALTAVQTQVRSLRQDTEAKLAAVEATHGREATLLAALQRVAIEPPEALAFAPGSPLETVRGGMLLSAVLPQLRHDTLVLDAQLADLDRLRAATQAKQAEVEERQVAVTAQQAHLAQLMARKRGLESGMRRAAAIEQRRLNALSAQASDLKDLIHRLDQERQSRLAAEAAAQRRAMAQAAAAQASDQTLPTRSAISRPSDRWRIHGVVAGQTILSWPVAGRVIKRFGQSDGFVTAKGLTIATTPGAEVVAPFDGQILFAGPFRSYGQILIIEHPGGYDSLLAGCDHIDSVVGQRVVAGEPVARMRMGPGNPSLYFEWRHKDQPIDPSSWMAGP